MPSYDAVPTASKRGGGGSDPNDPNGGGPGGGGSGGPGGGGSGAAQEEAEDFEEDGAAESFMEAVSWNPHHLTSHHPLAHTPQRAQ